MAGALAVRTFAKHKRNIHVGLRMDNKTAIFYVNSMGGTRAQSLVQPACQLWQWCLQRRITLSAEYLPGANNGIADKESRTMQSSAEWMLNVQVFKYIMHDDGPIPDQPVCSMSQSSVRPLCELVARSICHSDRCIPDYLEGLSGVRISTLWPSWQVSSKDSLRGKHSVLVAPVWIILCYSQFTQTF